MLPVLHAKNGTLPGYDYKDEWQGPFYFVQAADTQFGLIDRYVLNLEEPKWDKEIALTLKAIDKVNVMQPKPKFFIICGDMLDAFPEEQAELRIKQEKDFVEVFQKLDKGIPLVCVCGNHDIGDRPTATAVQRYRNLYGDDFFSFWVGGVLFLVLNSQFYEDGTLVPDLVEEQNKWLNEQLQRIETSRPKHVIVFQHIPLFVKNIDEEKAYWNFKLDLRQSLLDKFQAAGVKTVFCGHYHQNGGGWYKDVEVVVTSAIGAQLGPDQSGFRVVKVGESSISHRYFDLDSVPANIGSQL